MWPTVNLLWEKLELLENILFLDIIQLTHLISLHKNVLHLR